MFVFCRLQQKSQSSYILLLVVRKKVYTFLVEDQLMCRGRYVRYDLAQRCLHVAPLGLFSEGLPKGIKLGRLVQIVFAYDHKGTVLKPGLTDPQAAHRQIHTPQHLQPVLLTDPPNLHLRTLTSSPTNDHLSFLIILSYFNVTDLVVMTLVDTSFKVDIDSHCFTLLAPKQYQVTIPSHKTIRQHTHLTPYALGLRLRHTRNSRQTYRFHKQLVCLSNSRYRTRALFLLKTKVLLLLLYRSLCRTRHRLELSLSCTYLTHVLNEETQEVSLHSTQIENARALNTVLHTVIITENQTIPQIENSQQPERYHSHYHCLLFSLEARISSFSFGYSLTQALFRIESPPPIHIFRISPKWSSFPTILDMASNFLPPPKPSSSSAFMPPSVLRVLQWRKNMICLILAHLSVSLIAQSLMVVSQTTALPITSFPVTKDEYLDDSSDEFCAFGSMLLKTSPKTQQAPLQMRSSTILALPIFMAILRGEMSELAGFGLHFMSFRTILSILMSPEKTPAWIMLTWLKMLLTQIFIFFSAKYSISSMFPYLTAYMKGFQLLGVLNSLRR